LSVSRQHRRWASVAEETYHTTTIKMAEKLSIDRATSDAMQTSVIGRLIEGHGSCSRHDMIVAIKHSWDVSKCFSSQTENKRGKTFIQLISSFINFPRQNITESTKNKYSLIKALETLEKSSTRQTNRIQSWKDAKEQLEEIMDFESEIKSDEVMSNAENVGISIGLVDEKTGITKEEREIVRKFRQVELTPKSPKIETVSAAADDDQKGGVSLLDQADRDFMLRLKKVDDESMQRRKHPAIIEADAKLVAKEKAEAEKAARKAKEAAERRKRASALMRPLTAEEKELVERTLHAIGREDEVLAKIGADSVQRGSIQRLQPCQWLNDEVIHFFLTVLSKRDEEICANNSSKKRSHFFKSFFMSTLLNEGNANPALNGKYDYKNVKRWSKKVPGKDIFQLDKIFFPINQGGMHWVCAVAFMQEKRIQFYDSFGSDGMDYIECIFQYIQDEHQSKKSSPLPGQGDWSLVPCDDKTPHQLNGFDCGVFTCMFIDFLSRDCPLDVLGQDIVTECRERIALSILKGNAIM